MADNLDGYGVRLLIENRFSLFTYLRIIDRNVINETNCSTFSSFKYYLKNLKEIMEIA